MPTWAKRGLQSALLASGLLMLGTGISAAEEDAGLVGDAATGVGGDQPQSANLPPRVMTLDGLPTQALPNAGRPIGV